MWLCKVFGHKFVARKLVGDSMYLLQSDGCYRCGARKDSPHA